MKCPICTLSMRIYVTYRSTELGEAMNEQRRIRICPNDHKTDTVEVIRSDMQSLRTAAHMASRKP